MKASSSKGVQTSNTVTYLAVLQTPMIHSGNCDEKISMAAQNAQLPFLYSNCSSFCDCLFELKPCEKLLTAQEWRCVRCFFRSWEWMKVWMLCVVLRFSMIFSWFWADWKKKDPLVVKHQLINRSVDLLPEKSANANMTGLSFVFRWDYVLAQVLSAQKIKSLLSQIPVRNFSSFQSKMFVKNICQSTFQP